jgi:hypothetical protein
MPPCDSIANIQKKVCLSPRTLCSRYPCVNVDFVGIQFGFSLPDKVRVLVLAVIFSHSRLSAVSRRFELTLEAKSYWIEKLKGKVHN